MLVDVDPVDPRLEEGASPWDVPRWEQGPSPHLSWIELDCNDGTQYPEDWKRLRAVPLAVEFEWIRATCGGEPIPVGSGYRTRAWNVASKGARNSQHVEGRALDIYPPRHLLLPNLVDVVVAVAHRPGSAIHGIGVYRTFVHFDVRPGTRIARWKGSRVSAEVWSKVKNG